LARTLGAAAVTAPESVREAVAAASDGRGADCVLLTVGAPALVREAFGWARDGGAVHLFVGEGEGPLPIGDLYHRELTLTATYSSSPADLAEAFELVTGGGVRVAELCSHRMPLERLDEAARLMRDREALKVYIEVGA
jgi:L-iditol 2-dehydrogenase